MTSNKSLITFGIIAALLLFACGIFFTLGGIVYTGTAIPPGLYLRVDKPLGIDKLVTFCPPNLPAFQSAREQGVIKGGSCPDNYECLMLKVAAKRKDVVTINGEGVTVNNVLLPNSKPLDSSKLPPLAINKRELKENEILLMSGSADEPFDSRYFGIIETDQVDSVISPMF